MDDRSRHIDILFRNGLKEFEVLPPPEVWNNIAPSIRKRERPATIYRMAAMVAVFLSLSAAAVWFTGSLSGELYGPVLSLNQETFPEGSFIRPVSGDKTVVTGSALQTAGFKSESLPTVEQVSKDEIEPASFPEGVNNSTAVESSLNNRFYIPFRISGKNTFSTGTNRSSMPSGVKSISGGSHAWTLIAMASPDYYSNINTAGSQAASELAKDEKSAASYSGGMGVSYKVNKRVSIQSGVIYSSIGQKINGIVSYSGFSSYNPAKGNSAFSVETSSGTIVATNSNIFFRDNISGRVVSQYISDSFDPVKANLQYVNNSVAQNFSYLEIPVFLRYKAIDRKIDVNLIGGLSYNMLVGNSVSVIMNGEKLSVGKTEGLNTINFSSALGLGFEYNLSGNVSLNVEPTFRYYLTPFGNISGSSVHPYAFGVLSGLSYKF